MTGHHTLPKHLNPKKNFICPVCYDCHTKLNMSDHVGLIKFAYKIDKSFKELGEMVRAMLSNLRKPKNGQNPGDLKQRHFD